VVIGGGRWAVSKRARGSKPAAMPPADAPVDAGEEGSGEKGQEPFGHPRRDKRNVTWELVDGACKELLKKQPSWNVSVPLRSRSQRLVQCCQEAFETLGLMCAECFAFRHRRPSSSSSRRRTIAELPGRQGYLWKLNSDADDDLCSLRSWRRRLFLLRDNSGKHSRIALMYLSEKHDGELTLACALDGSSAVERISLLPEVIVEPPSPRTRYWARSNLHQYSVAFGFDDSGGPEACDGLVPARLYPFSVAWQDALLSEQRVVLAAGTEEVRGRWLSSMRDKLSSRPRRGSHGERKRRIV